MRSPKCVLRLRESPCCQEQQHLLPVAAGVLVRVKELMAAAAFSASQQLNCQILIAQLEPAANFGTQMERPGPSQGITKTKIFFIRL